ncbi:MAG: septal ring lytic transglycosylase RlpA family protein [Proteobacteria bacterium]|nr:septal ring lytic transglycosylase RlpA family protein [Pseudomonadota bacterium]
MRRVAPRAAVLAPAVLALVLGACSEVQLVAYTAKEIAARVEGTPPEGVYKVGDPYQMYGTWYYPEHDPEYNEIGIASWYGEPFHGRATANGSVYDMNALTAAHKTLPMPSMVMVTNLENGRSLTLTVNDRGPFTTGRIIDVSRRAAQLLGFSEQGTTLVRIQAVRAEPAATMVASPSPAAEAAQPPQAAAAPPPAAEAAQPPQVITQEPLPAIALAPMVPEDFTRAPAPTFTLAAKAPEAAATEPPTPIVLVGATPEAAAAEPPPPIALVGVTPEAAAAAPPPPPITLVGATPEAAAAEPPPAIALAAAMPLAVAADEAVTMYIQAGAFTKLDNARRLSATLARFGPARMTRAVVRGREFYRVRIGPIGTREEANALLARVIAAGHSDALSVID